MKNEKMFLDTRGRLESMFIEINRTFGKYYKDKQINGKQYLLIESKGKKESFVVEDETCSYLKFFKGEDVVIYWTKIDKEKLCKLIISEDLLDKLYGIKSNTVYLEYSKLLEFIKLDAEVKKTLKVS